MAMIISIHSIQLQGDLKTFIIWLSFLFYNFLYTLYTFLQASLTTPVKLMVLRQQLSVMLRTTVLVPASTVKMATAVPQG